MLFDAEGLSKRGIALSWTPQVVELLASAGFDLRYGARPLQRAIEQLVVAPLSKFLLAHPRASERSIELSTDAQGIHCAAR